MESVLKIMTCGSVDDGKSTLIGHLLYDAKMLFADQKRALELESRAMREDGVLDYSLLLDGLSAEREQGITIDVAYRYFATEKRSFVVADTPGHEAYTRNMAVAASQSDLAVLLIDAEKGVTTQTRRHLRICAMMGIREYVFAVNKMDAAGYRKDVFDRIRAGIESFVADIPHHGAQMIPLSALCGDNVAVRSAHMPWYEGPTLLGYLETVDVEAREEQGFLMPVQRVARAGGIRYLQGNVVSGEIGAGEDVTVYPGAVATKVNGILVSGKTAPRTVRGEAAAVSLTDDLDVSRGFVLASGTDLKQARMLQADILWMDEKPLMEGKNYLLKLASQTVNAGILRLKYGVDPDTGKHLACRRVEKNGLACADIVCHEDLVFDRFDRHPAMGRFILIDKVTNSTAGCGTIRFALRRTENVARQSCDVTPEDRARALGQSPRTVWFTGLSGSGKSALANELEKLLAAEGRHTMLLDGDNVRLGISKDLGFNDYDRTENIRRIAEISRLLNDAGIIVLAACISPFAADRDMAREIIGAERFMEIYVSTPLAECEKRDVKGLYKKARMGEIPNFTGINSPYEAPAASDAEIDTSGADAAALAAELLESLKGRFD
ncbi:MAG: adenylyl-sulfate kinase [Lachnospiraceae bacterium]|nr:adenylyl-sulfate kinase [Lachnospiraceae bacterium]